MLPVRKVLLGLFEEYDTIISYEVCEVLPVREVLLGLFEECDTVISYEVCEGVTC